MFDQRFHSFRIDILPKDKASVREEYGDIDRVGIAEIALRHVCPRDAIFAPGEWVRQQIQESGRSVCGAAAAHAFLRVAHIEIQVPRDRLPVIFFASRHVGTNRMIVQWVEFVRGSFAEATGLTPGWHWLYNCQIEDRIFGRRYLFAFYET